MAGPLRFTLVIPSYWGRRTGEPFNKEDAVYDHPTPLDEEGTLKRALQSIPLLGCEQLSVMVLGASTHPDLEDEVEKRLEDVVAPFRSLYPIAVLSHSHARDMQRMLAQGGPEGCSRMLSLRGYSNIRNLGLVVACLTGADAAVLFDDDQVYEDPSYLEKVAENIGKEHRGRFIGGLAGYYVNPNGDYHLPANLDPIFSEWPVVEYMNRALDIIAGEERLRITPWVFGGNMVIHRELYMNVAFDPHVTRGEDIDYLTNAKFLDYDFFLDNTLWVRHLPPPKTAPLWRRFREDLDRFVYAREKLRSQVSEEGCRMVGVDELDPYPGRFLRDDLEEMIFRTCVLMGMDYLARGDKEGFTECMANVLRARSGFPAGLNPFRRYLEWRSRWQELMDFLSRDGGLREYVSDRYF